MTKEEIEKRNQLVLELKKFLCEYTFFHKKMKPEDIYMPIENTAKCLASCQNIIKILREEGKDKKIDYINTISATGEIRIRLEEKEHVICLEVQPDGEVVATKIYKKIDKLKEDKEIKEYINNI